MPAATYPDNVSIYGYLPDDRFPAAFMSLVAQAQPRGQTEGLQSALYEVLDASSAWSMGMDLTAQGMDLMGNERPYDCDDLVDFFFTDARTLDEYENVQYRLITFERIGELRGILAKTLAQPLFPEEKVGWEELERRLSRLTAGSLISVYSY